MEIQPFFDPATSTLTYVVFDRDTHDAVIIDPVLDYDPLASRTTTTSVEAVGAFVDARALRVHFILETHAHADHLTAAPWLRGRFGAKVAIGEHIRDVQARFRDLLDLELVPDGQQFDLLVADGARLSAGSLAIDVLATPGHTPACVTYRIGDALFTGDALFMHDHGTGRADFPGGSAAALFDSVTRLYTLPDATRVFPGHDYQPGGRALAWETTIGRSKESNPQLSAATTKNEFVALRSSRDKTLAPPRLLYPSIQVNLDGGRLPAPHANGRRYLQIPISDGSPIADVEPTFVAAHRDELLVIDVREASELTGELGHIEGARHIPLAEIAATAPPVDVEREIVLVCRSGQRSSRAASELARRGFRHLYNLRGGMLAWNAAHLPVAR